MGRKGLKMADDKRSGSVASDMASIPGPSRDVRPVGLRPEPEPARELTAEEMAVAAGKAACEALGVEGGVFDKDRLAAQLRRAERRKASDAREVAAMAGVRAVPRRTRKVMAGYDREKPTREAQRTGEFEVVDAASLGASDRKGDPVLLDWRSRAGGAGEMAGKGQIGKRELMAAVRLMSLVERARAAQVSGVALAERVDGGGPAGDGGRLAWAASASGEYREAMGRLSRLQRSLVEWRVVLGKPMEEVVQLRSVAARLGAGQQVRYRCNKALVALVEGLDALADYFGLPED